MSEKTIQERLRLWTTALASEPDPYRFVAMFEDMREAADLIDRLTAAPSEDVVERDARWRHFDVSQPVSDNQLVGSHSLVSRLKRSIFPLMRLRMPRTSGDRADFFLSPRRFVRTLATLDFSFTSSLVLPTWHGTQSICRFVSRFSPPNFSGMMWSH